ncbi:MAG: C13 family peptidase, partial [Pseudomonadota bacterium]
MKGIQVFKDALHNIRLIASISTLRPRTEKRLRIAVGQAALPFSLYVLLGVLSQAAIAWPIAGANYWEIPTFLSIFFVFFSLIVVLGAVVRRGRTLAEFIVGSLYALLLGGLIGTPLEVMGYRTGEPAALYTYMVVALWPWFCFVARYFAAPWRKMTFVFVPAQVLVLAGIAAFSTLTYEPTLFSTALDSNTAGAEGSYLDNFPDPEIVYYGQERLMAQELDDLLPGRVGEPELFAILGAGYAHQRVFLSEIASVSALLESDFSARDRVIHLANSSAEPTRFPLMNATNLSEALSATAEAMNSGEDLALLFLTSHGNTDVFSTQFAGISYKDISAPQLADMIDASGIENLIVVVSACYSGSFIDDLAADDRLIITAAGA